LSKEDLPEVVLDLFREWHLCEPKPLSGETAEAIRRHAHTLFDGFQPGLAWEEQRDQFVESLEKHESEMLSTDSSEASSEGLREFIHELRELVRRADSGTDITHSHVETAAFMLGRVNDEKTAPICGLKEGDKIEFKVGRGTQVGVVNTTPLPDDEAVEVIANNQSKGMTCSRRVSRGIIVGLLERGCTVPEVGDALAAAAE
jgi:hypothetical protein